VSSQEFRPSNELWPGGRTCVTMPRGHCETKERAEKDGVWPTITYACARMRYGRGRCVIGTLSVVDRERVLLPRMRRRTALPAGAKRLNVQKCGGRAIELSPLIRRKCHDALLWQLKWNFKGMRCLVWRTVITTAGESCNETRCGSRVRRPRPVAFTGEDRTQAS